MRSDARGWRAGFFSVAITLVSRVLMARDELLGRTRSPAKADGREEFFFASGGRRLAGVWVAGTKGAPVILICHGIGETGGHWNAVQAFLAQRGVGSMFFNYSGYGKSSGTIRAEHCDEDLVAAYAELRRRVGPEARVFVLGFSLGSGIAACGVGALAPQSAGLILCEAYTSFRDAVCATRLPRWLARGFPDVWKTVAVAPTLRLPVLVVHSDRDRLFPVEMARRIAQACGGGCELVVVHGLTHNEPYLKPTEAYWGPILQWMGRVGR
jgi:alpha-beta hydrolase superfamily lysophospholipase